jgi:hypothetical protein
MNDPYWSVMDYDREEARTTRGSDRYATDNKPSASDLAYDAQLDNQEDNR